jgi:hypothetical protein
MLYRAVAWSTKTISETQTRFVFNEAAKLGEIKKSNEKVRANYRRFLEEMTWCQS